MWKLQSEAEYEKRAKRWPKKHQREFAAVHDHLDALLLALNCGAKVEEAVKRGYVHSERRGAIAIDQKGGGGGLKETRLYVYLNKSSQLIHLITFGDKSTQKDDVKYASEFVGRLTTDKK